MTKVELKISLWGKQIEHDNYDTKKTIQIPSKMPKTTHLFKTIV